MAGSAGAGTARALILLGNLARGRGDCATARTLYEGSLAAFRELGDGWGIAGAPESFGAVAHAENDVAAALSFFTQSLVAARTQGDKRRVEVPRRGSHIVMQRRAAEGTTIVPVPDHRGVRIGTLCRSSGRATRRSIGYAPSSADEW